MKIDILAAGARRCYSACMTRWLSLVCVLAVSSCDKGSTTAPEDKTATGDAPQLNVHLCCDSRGGVDGVQLALSGCEEHPIDDAAECEANGRFWVDCDEATHTGTSYQCKEHPPETGG